MPRPRQVRPLPELPHLPMECRLLAEFVLECPRSSTDYLLLTAEACEELACHLDRVDGLRAAACRRIAFELRMRAPEYAG